MQYPESAVPVWFGNGRMKDAQCLEAWRKSPLTFYPGIALDNTWAADRYEIFLGNDPSRKLFEQAAWLVMTNQFYPPQVMVSCADYSEQNRPLKLGDRVLQRIRVFQIAGRPVLEILTLNEITEVILEEQRVGFTYTTTQTHSEIGEWSPKVEWRENGDVFLIIDVLSRIRPGASNFLRRFTRKLQLRAHRLSINNFQNLLNFRARAARAPRFSAELLPLGLLAVAAFIVLLALVGVRRAGE